LRRTARKIAPHARFSRLFAFRRCCRRMSGTADVLHSESTRQKTCRGLPNPITLRLGGSTSHPRLVRSVPMRVLQPGGECGLSSRIAKRFCIAMMGFAICSVGYAQTKPAVAPKPGTPLAKPAAPKPAAPISQSAIDVVRLNGSQPLRTTPARMTINRSDGSLARRLRNTDAKRLAA
jgi:hypothetical protein